MRDLPTDLRNWTFLKYLCFNWFPRCLVFLLLVFLDIVRFFWQEDFAMFDQLNGTLFVVLPPRPSSACFWIVFFTAFRIAAFGLVLPSKTLINSGAACLWEQLCERNAIPFHQWNYESLQASCDGCSETNSILTIWRSSKVIYTVRADLMILIGTGHKTIWKSKEHLKLINGCRKGIKKNFHEKKSIKMSNWSQRYFQKK